MKILGKILGVITLILGILLICSYLVVYINQSIPEASKFLPEMVTDIFETYVFPWAALIIVGAMVLTTMMKHSIVLTIIFAVLIGAVVIFMIVGQSSNSTTPETPETFINAIKALNC